MEVIIYQSNLFAISILLTLVLALLNLPIAESVCEEDSCKTLANNILSSLQESVNPCDDFYQYACGSWPAKHEIPSGVSRFSQLDALLSRLTNILQDLLEEPELVTDRIAVKAAKIHYKACMDENKINTEGLTLLLMNIYANGGWPILSPNDSVQTNYVSWQNVHDYYLRNTGMGALYSFVTADQPTPNKFFQIILDAFNTTSYQNVDKSNRTETKKYVNFLTDLALEFARAINNGSDIQREKIHQDAQDVLNFQKAVEEVKERATDESYMTIAEFNNLIKTDAPNVKFDILRSYLIMGLPVNPSTRIHVRSLSYFRNLNLLIRKTPNRVILNYINYHFVEHHIIYSTTKMRNLLSEMYQMPQMNRSVFCLKSPILKYALSSMYVRRYAQQIEIHSASATVFLMKIMLAEQINRTQWIDEPTLKLFVKKLMKMSGIMWYKDSTYFRDNVVDEQYAQYMISNNYLQNTLNYEAINFKKKLSYFLQPAGTNVDSNRATSSPIDTTIFYDVTHNKLEIPAAIMMRGSLLDDYSPIIIYAGFGSFISYYMASLFDRVGYLFDENGAIRWTSHNENSVDEAHDERLACFTKQYTSNVNKELGIDYFKDKPPLLVESVHDSFGLKTAFDAYTHQVEWNTGTANFLLPNLDKFSEKQQFFLVFANRYCETIDPSALKDIITNSEKTTSKIRVNSAVSNLAEFSEAFGCTADSPMNPTRKCSLFD